MTYGLQFPLTFPLTFNQLQPPPYQMGSATSTNVWVAKRSGTSITLPSTVARYQETLWINGNNYTAFYYSYPGYGITNAAGCQNQGNIPVSAGSTTTTSLGCAAELYAAH